MARSGTIVLPVINTDVPGPDEPAGEVMVEAHPENTGVVLVGDAASVATGYAMTKGQQIVLRLANLNELRFRSGAANDKVCWIKVW